MERRKAPNLLFGLCACNLHTNVCMHTKERRDRERKGKKERRGGGRREGGGHFLKGKQREVSVTTRCFHPPALQACNILHGWSMQARGRHDYSFPAHWRLFLPPYVAK